MPQLGADPEALRSLATRLRRASRDLDDIAISLERRVRSTGWRGVDADAFGTGWQLRERPALQVTADRFRDAATALDRQAHEQLRASAGSATGLLAPRSATVVGPVDSARDVDVTRLPSPDPLPRSELRVAAGSEVVGGLLLGGLAHDVTVQQLERARSRVVVTESTRGGAAVTAGASVRLGASGPGLGASGQISATVGSIVRREYLVADREVWPTVARVEAELGLGRTVAAGRALPGLGLVGVAAGSVVAAWDRVLDGLPGPDVDLAEALEGISVAPEPDRVEQLAEISLSVGAGVALASSLGVQAGADVTGTVRYGTAQGGESGGSGGSRILELEGAIAATVGGSLLERVDLSLPGDLDRSSALRLELPDRVVDGVDLVITTTTTDAAGLHQQTSNLALTDAVRRSAVATVAESLRHLQEGDPAAALRALAGLGLTVESIATTSGRMSIEDHTLGAGAAGGQGVGVAFSGEAGVQRLDRID